MVTEMLDEYTNITGTKVNTEWSKEWNRPE